MKEQIKKAFKIYQEKIKSKEPFSMKEVLLEAGYSQSYSKTPSVVTESNSWRKLLSRYPDDLILDKLYMDALGDGRDATENRKLFLKIKGRLKDSVSLDINKERISLYDEIEDDEEET
jgi:hypothetical protein